MLPLKYSKFFRSGFLAKERPTKTQSIPEEPIAESSTTRSRRGSILSIGSRKRRPEPVSLVLPSLPPSETSSILPIPEKKHSRIPFSSWLFDRRQMTSEDPYLSFSNAPPANRRELYDVPETVDVWITSGGPYTPKAIEKRSHEDDFFSHPLDPFDTSSDSKSVYLDLPEIRSPTPPTARQESFLSLSTPSSNLSVVNINLNVAITRKERPTSIQTMPLPALSRTSSIHRNSKSDRSRWSVVTAADTEPATATLEPLQDAADTSWQDLTHSTDWRQFHLDLLKDD